jgi:hypothetical protein
MQAKASIDNTRKVMRDQDRIKIKSSPQAADYRRNYLSRSYQESCPLGVLELSTSMKLTSI